MTFLCHRISRCYRVCVVSFFKEGETVIDCYAGGGLLTAMLAKKRGRAIGVEIVPEAAPLL